MKSIKQQADEWLLEVTLEDHARQLSDFFKKAAFRDVSEAVPGHEVARLIAGLFAVGIATKKQMLDASPQQNFTTDELGNRSYQVDVAESIPLRDMGG